MNILYLEDDSKDARLFDLYIKHELPGTNVKIARSYSEYIRALHSDERFDVIICDYRVPGFNGLSAIDIARNERPGAWVIFITGARLDLIPEAKMSGADFALEKVGFMDLIVVLKDCAKGSKE